MDRPDVLAKIVIEQCDVDVSDAEDDWTLAELGLTSLNIMRVLVAVEATFGFECTSDDVERAMSGTLGDLRAIVGRAAEPHATA